MQLIRNFIESIKDKYHDYEFEITEALSDINFSAHSSLRRLILFVLNILAVVAIVCPFRIALSIITLLLLLSIINAYTFFSSRKTYFLAHAKKIDKPLVYTTEETVKKDPPKPHRSELQQQQQQQVQQPLTVKPRTYNVIRFTTPNQRIAHIENNATAEMTIAQAPKPSKFRVILDIVVFVFRLLTFRLHLYHTNTRPTSVNNSAALKRKSQSGQIREIVAIDRWEILYLYRDVFIYFNPLHVTVVGAAALVVNSWFYRLYMLGFAFLIAVMINLIVSQFEMREADWNMITRETAHVQQSVAEGYINARREIEVDFYRTAIEQAKEALKQELLAEQQAQDTDEGTMDDDEDGFEDDNLPQPPQMYQMQPQQMQQQQMAAPVMRNNNQQQQYPQMMQHQQQQQQYYAQPPPAAKMYRQRQVAQQQTMPAGNTQQPQDDGYIYPARTVQPSGSQPVAAQSASATKRRRNDDAQPKPRSLQFE